MFYRYEVEENGERDQYKILVLGEKGIWARYIDKADYDLAMESGEVAIDILNKNGFSYIKSEDRVFTNSKVEFAYSAPTKLFVDITNRCNLRCKHCLSGIKEYQNLELSSEFLEKIAYQCGKYGVKYVKLGGGEPFMHRSLENVCEAFSNAGCSLSMSTNGYFTSSREKNIVRKYNIKISISIEGIEKTDEEIRGKGHFSRAMNALKEFREVTDNVILRVTLNRKNIFELPQLVELADSLNVPLKISLCRPAGNALQNDLLISHEDHQLYLDAVNFINREDVINKVLLDKSMMIHHKAEDAAKYYFDKTCGAGTRTMHIDSFGVARPCIFMGNSIQGEKVNEDGDFMHIWKEGNQDFDWVRNIAIFEKCKKCNRICKNECLGNLLYGFPNNRLIDNYCLNKAGVENV